MPMQHQMAASHGLCLKKRMVRLSSPFAPVFVLSLPRSWSLLLGRMVAMSPAIKGRPGHHLANRDFIPSVLVGA